MEDERKVKKANFFIWLLLASVFLIASNNMEVKAAEEKKAEGKHVKSDYEVTHTGSGISELGITGEADGEYDLLIEITKSGGLKEGYFQCSTDKGKTWGEERQIPLSGIYILGSTGLIMEFYSLDDMGFLAGDTYHCYIPDPTKKIVIKQEIGSKVNITVESVSEEVRAFDVLENAEAAIKIKIIKEGTIGTAVWKLSTDGGLTWDEEEYAKEELLLSFGKNTNGQRVTIKFSPEPGTEVDFLRNDVISIYAERTEKDGTITALVVLAVIVAGISAGIYFGNKILKSAIPSESDYELRDGN